MTEAERSQLVSRPVLLYDGVCVLCNGVVHFLLRRDAQGVFRFVPLQSPLGTELLAAPSQLDGVILLTETLTAAQKIHYRSDAVASALGILGGRWAILGRTLRLIPRPLREFGYGLIARVRYRLFGRYTTCPIPSPSERSRILGLDQ
ncbi:thiol-disulfide oxidoreductase DCC family protein [Edaphobacter bradus]|uniref:thiol-disulfide oxidoreductase DCC family protein n=1 Tax=Edaphobacter bradus TaxID=2259016 RepID=UPI0021E0190A|nr:DCC1-like thiol-disulfide oxidoreductase family protein [Edaphobacter bradus]